VVLHNRANRDLRVKQALPVNRDLRVKQALPVNRDLRVLPENLSTLN
jgi:hypothetical protein